jgi:branched-chain amino acid transport system permease protein
MSEETLLQIAQLVEVLIGGLMSGVLYSLVALGFVLIFKASGVFNFAQGAMVLFAALALVRLMEVMPLVAAMAVTIVLMIAVAFAIERLVLRPLVGQHALILFMATIGVTFFLDGFGQMIWGSNVYTLDLGIPAAPWFILDPPFTGGVLLSPIDAFAALVAGALVLGLSLFFHGTKVGRALRAVADDHQAAQSVGIPLNRIWLIVWSAAGIVALFAGMAWGTKAGVQFSLSIVALRALPVVIVGGLTSIPGAILGGLLIGAGEKLFEFYIGQPMLGGGTEVWFAYVVALAVLLVRPQGLFGERIIERI